MRLVIFIFLSVFILSADEIEWQESYKEALKIAKTENKNVMMLISKPKCRWCKKLKFTTLEDEDIIERINDKYISVEVSRGDGTYPEVFDAPYVPMTYFITPTGKRILKVGGYWAEDSFHSWLNDAEKRLKKMNN